MLWSLATGLREVEPADPDIVYAGIISQSCKYDYHEQPCVIKCPGALYATASFSRAAEDLQYLCKLNFALPISQMKLILGNDP